MWKDDDDDDDDDDDGPREGKANPLIRRGCERDADDGSMLS